MNRGTSWRIISNQTVISIRTQTYITISNRTTALLVLALCWNRHLFQAWLVLWCPVWYNYSTTTCTLALWALVTMYCQLLTLPSPLTHPHFELLENKMDLQNKDDVNVNPLLLLLTLGVSLCFICHVNLTTCPTPWPLLTLRGKQRRGVNTAVKCNNF